jgi:hypothetical protein
LDPTPYTARIETRSEGREIVLTNGLVERVIRIAPNAATTGLTQLSTGQSIIRGVKPEALVTIDGTEWEVGGLKGQPNYAFLTPEWLEDLKASPTAFQYKGHEIGIPKERFAWARVRHASSEAVWPPKGVSLRLDFEGPSLTDDQLMQLIGGQSGGSGAYESSFGRDRLAADDFSQTNDDWVIHESSRHDRSSFSNEAKFGEIYTPANSSVYAERALPDGTRAVEATIDPGTDRSESWGPGMAIMFKDRSLKLFIRTAGSGGDGKPRISAWDGAKELVTLGKAGGVRLDKPVSLRIRIEGQTARLDARQAPEPWAALHSVDLGEKAGAPTAVRVGKMDKSGGGSDFATPGELGRMKVISFSAWGAMNPNALGEIAQKIRQVQDIGVSVHYEIYDGVPSFSKWITVHNGTGETIDVQRFTSEILTVVEQENQVEMREGNPLRRPDSLHVETDYAFGGFMPGNAMLQSVKWGPDPEFSTQVNYLRQQPALLEVTPKRGPAQLVAPGETFESFRAFELAYDSTDRERRGLSLRKMYRKLAPWVTENPLILHVTSTKEDVVKTAIDQAAECGFEIVSLSFGSGLNMEDESPENLAKFKEFAEYARAKGLDIGGYSLLSSRRIGNGQDVVSPEGERPTHGSCPALTSEWGQEYFRKLYKFYEKTGFLQFTHDGSYPGDADTTARPPLQRGLEDSTWAQWKVITDFYKWQRAQGVYVRVPDYYFMSGANESGMGYREVNWSLPRAEQVIHTRQNIYDGTWLKAPSMGWMFVPLTQYHGGGAAATIEPLDKHIDHYERMLTSNLGLGVQAVYRGFRLYDTPRVRDMVIGWMDWFKEHREILESDVIHCRRADARDLDFMLHANPALETRGMLSVYNPLRETVRKPIRVNLYYTGLTESAEVSLNGGAPQRIKIGPMGWAQIDVEVSAQGFSWVTIKK